MNVPVDITRAGSRRRWLVLGAVVVILAAGLVTFAVTSGGSGDDASGSAATATSSSAAPTSAAPTSAAPTSTGLAPVAVTPEPSGPTSNADEPPASLGPVALDQPAEVGNGVSAEVLSLEAIDGTAVGPGNVSGPALRVTVRLTNGTAGQLSLGGVSVDLAHGPEATPASPLDDPSAAPFSGTVEAGGTAQGVYVFSIAEGDRAEVTLSVGYQAGAPFLVFTGAAP